MPAMMVFRDASCESSIPAGSALLKIHAPGAPHPIIFRGIERRKVFRDNKDRDTFLKAAEEKYDTSDCRHLTFPEPRAIFLLKISTKLESLMATVNFSVPDDVKSVFNRVFAGRNKSAVISDLMMRAVEEEKIRQRRAQAIDRLLERRSAKRPVTSKEIRETRKELRS